MDLEEVYIKYPTNEHCIKYLEKVLWDNNPFCPYCKSKKYSALKITTRYHCNNCNTSYSVLIDTIFKSTKIELQKWFFAIAIIKNSNISSRELANLLSVTKDTAWRMQLNIKKSSFENSNYLKNILS